MSGSLIHLIINYFAYIRLYKWYVAFLDCNLVSKKSERDYYSVGYKTFLSTGSLFGYHCMK